MPPLRRSQGEPPAISSAPRTSGRKSKPTKKKASTPNIAESAIDTPDQLSTTLRKPPTKKDLLPDTRVGDTAGAAANADFHGNSREGRQAVKDHDARQSREVAASNRLRAKREKETKAWENECTNYGEEEIWRRYYEELEAARDANIIPTSELEDLAVQDEVVDPLVTVDIEYRVDKKHVWSHNFSQCRSNDFAIRIVENMIDEAIKQREGSKHGWNTCSILAVVKAKHSRATRKNQTMDELSAMEWIKVLELVGAQAAEYKPVLIVSITVNAKADKEMIKAYKKAMIKQAHEDLSSDPQDLEGVATPKAMTTRKQLVRTDRLLDAAQIRKAAAEDVGKYNLQLLEKWLCVDERCSNANNKYDKAWC